MNNQINLTAEEQAKLELVLDGRNKASISTAQWFAFVSPFERFRHCTIEVLYKRPVRKFCSLLGMGLRPIKISTFQCVVDSYKPLDLILIDLRRKI